jgi:hypothetical protein
VQVGTSATLLAAQLAVGAWPDAVAAGVLEDNGLPARVDPSRGSGPCRDSSRARFTIDATEDAALFDAVDLSRCGAVVFLSPSGTMFRAHLAGGIRSVG